ncbi:MAG: hypothetical protein EXQ96_08740 [Alphaproteobacteria bacterium]|nr:hypothetical protein [Alphaproteobacteria bacterium]
MSTLSARAIVAALLALLLAACAGTGGEGRTHGTIDATATAPAPAGRAVRVVAEDGRTDSTLGPIIARGLRDRGMTVADDGTLRLAYRLGFGPGDPPERPGVSVGGVIGSSGTRDLGIGIGLPLLNWFGPRETRFTLAVILKRDDDDGVLWQGWITGATRDEDAGRAARATASLLLGYLGDTVRGWRFNLP